MIDPFNATGMANRLPSLRRGADDIAPPTPGFDGTGLKGLTGRLAVAGGSLEAGPGPAGGFVATAELPADAPGAPEGGAAGDG